ncbi:MAG: hypothetical protein JW731_05070 [Bacteroidales bacterium]|nr:hypothetical protein [Bacteroidales bacterium]
MAEPRGIYKEWFITLIAASSGEPACRLASMTLRYRHTTLSESLPELIVSVGRSLILLFQFTIVSEITASLI